MPYLFILCPPYSGSTLLWKLVGTSDAVSTLPKEGQYLPKVREIMRQDPWNPEINYPWEKIKETWNKYWNHEKSFLVEKSPPHIIHTDSIIKHFKPVYFLLMVRNPYAHCEGIVRRNHMNAKDAAKFTIHCLRKQKENKEKLKDVLCFTYEELVADPRMISRKIESSIPQIGKIRYDKRFKIHSIDGNVERKIVDLNIKKIRNLSYNNLKKINSVLKNNMDILNYWGYRYYNPCISHDFLMMTTRAEMIVTKAFNRGIKFASKIPQKMWLMDINSQCSSDASQKPKKPD